VLAHLADATAQAVAELDQFADAVATGVQAVGQRLQGLGRLDQFAGGRRHSLGVQIGPDRVQGGDQRAHAVDGPRQYVAGFEEAGFHHLAGGLEPRVDLRAPGSLKGRCESRRGGR
jgi:hypothetical protein